MAERDPRTDPQPGDVVRSHMDGTLFVVTGRGADRVQWQTHRNRDECACDLDGWTDMLDTVIYTSPTPSAPLPASPDAQTESSGDGHAVPWEHAGGPDECPHGYAAGIPCGRCAQFDRRLVAVERVAARHPEAIRLLRLMIEDPDSYATLQAVTEFLAGVGRG